MMGTKHKHAEVIIAIVEGKEVQFSRDNGETWRDCDLITLRSGADPFTNADLCWRIKPEPKPDIVRYMRVYFHNINDRGVNTTNHTDWQEKHDNVKITFDGETNKPKAVELIK